MPFNDIQCIENGTTKYKTNYFVTPLCREDTAKRIKFLAEFSETSFSQVTDDLCLKILRDGGLFEQVLKPEKSPGRKNGMLAKALEGKPDGNVSVLMSHINCTYERIMIPNSRQGR